MKDNPRIIIDGATKNVSYINAPTAKAAVDPNNKINIIPNVVPKIISSNTNIIVRPINSEKKTRYKELYNVINRMKTITLNNPRNRVDVNFKLLISTLVSELDCLGLV